MPVNNEFFIDFDDASSKYDSEGRLLTKGQLNFFNRSQCVDDNNCLLVLYHASNSNFTTFDPKRIGSGGGSIYGKGFYFSDDSFNIEIYGKYVREFYLNLKNPFRWESIEEEADATYNLDMFIEVLEANNFVMPDGLLEELEDDLINNDGGLDTVIEKTCGFDFAQKYCQRAGYEGIKVLDIGDYVAHQPEQIKLCSTKMPSAAADAAE
jgi:hypothetical protein